MVGPAGCHRRAAAACWRPVSSLLVIVAARRSAEATSPAATASSSDLLRTEAVPVSGFPTAWNSASNAEQNATEYSSNDAAAGVGVALGAPVPQAAPARTISTVATARRGGCFISCSVLVVSP